MFVIIFVGVFEKARSHFGLINGLSLVHYVYMLPLL